MLGVKGDRLARAFLVLAATTMAAASAEARQASGSAARSIPKDGLFGYFEFDGLDRHAESWRKTAAYRLLNETTCGVMLEEVFKQSVDGILRDAPASKPTGAQVLEVVEGMARSGFAIGLRGKLGSDDLSAVVVISNTKADLHDKALAALSMGAPTEKISREDGRKVTIVKPSPESSWAWWRENDELTIVLGKAEAAIEVVAETRSGKRPAASAHPLRAELVKKSDGFDPVMVSFLDLTDLPPTPPESGLSGLKRIESVWGFRGEALESLVRVVAPAPRKGLLALIDQPAFGTTGDLGIPDGVSDFTVISIDPLKVYDAAVALAKTANPQAGPMVEQLPKMVKDVTGLELREEILGRVGPRMGFFAVGDKVTIPTTPYHSMAQWFLHLPKYVMFAETKDEAAFLKSADALSIVINRHIEALFQQRGMKGTIAFRPLKGGAKGYELDVPLSVFPLPVGVRPGFAVGGGRVVFSTDVDAARAEVARKPAPASSDAAMAKALNGLPDRVTMLNVSDPREYMPEVIANIPFFVQALSAVMPRPPSAPPAGVGLAIDRDMIPSPAALRKYLFPSTATVSVDADGLTFRGRDSFPNVSSASAAPVMAGLLLPAVSSAREAARRSQSVNNLKQIMLAYHNYHAANNFFPPAAICDGEGKPLLSWRVAILPYIEQDALYKEFHLDEPWDSEHNKKLIERMPAIYGSTNIQPKTPFSTFYQTFVGEGALNAKYEEKGRSLGDITDGTSNTFGVVEAGEAVVWTKPADVKIEAEKPIPKLGGPGFGGGFNAAFCDGSVRFIKNSIDPEVLKALITIAGGEVINANDF